MTQGTEPINSAQYYDSREDTLAHIEQVRRRLANFARELEYRGRCHDHSKLSGIEKECYDTVVPSLKGLVYGSPEYKATVAKLGPGLVHHFAHNGHHPECWPNGIAGMDLVDLVEMYCDWTAAAVRGGHGDMTQSLEINITRYGITGVLADILRATWRRHGGFCGYEHEDKGNMSPPPPGEDPEATWIVEETITMRRKPKPNRLLSGS